MACRKCMVTPTQTSVSTEKRKLTKALFLAEWNIWRPRSKKSCSAFLFGIQLRLTAMVLSIEGSETPLAEGPTHFPQCTLETGGPGSPSRSVPFERLPTDCHAKQQNQPRRTVGTRYVEYMPSQPPPTNTYTLLKSCFFSLTAVTQVLCPLLGLAARSHSLSCLCPFCMCELRLQPPAHEGQPNSFLLYLFPNTITQPGQDCPSVNGKGILREIVVGNNKPTCHEDKSIFKALGFSRTTA